MKKWNKKQLAAVVIFLVIILTSLFYPSVTEIFFPETESVIQTQVEESNTKQENGFRTEKLRKEHYEKHGKEMGYKSADAYEQAAIQVVNNPTALHKIEAEDGDDVYYIEQTNEFVIVSTDGYIRTYFNPAGGKSYFERQ